MAKVPAAPITTVARCLRVISQRIPASLGSSVGGATSQKPVSVGEVAPLIVTSRRSDVIPDLADRSMVPAWRALGVTARRSMRSILHTVAAVVAPWYRLTDSMLAPVV